MMDIFDLNGNPMESPDLALGYLRDEQKTVYHDAIEGVVEQWHYETVREYENGGKDVRRVIDVPGVEAKDAWDETVSYQVYVPYTEEELQARQAQQEAEAAKPSLEEQLDELREQNQMLLECLLELSELVYA